MVSMSKNIWVISPSHSKNLLQLVKIAILYLLTIFTLSKEPFEIPWAYHLGL